MRWLCSIALSIALSLAAASSHAHKASDAYWTVEVAGERLTQRLDIALRDLDREIAVDANEDGQLAWGEVRSRWPAIESLAAAGARVQADGRACTVTERGAPALDEHSDGRYAVMRQTLVCDGPVADLTLHYTLFAASDATHRGVVRLVRGDATHSAVLDPSAPAQRFGSDAAAPRTFFGFVGEGVHHILIGADHILFLLALLLPAVLAVRRTPAPPASPGPALLDVLRIVTAFTVAHSITLALAVFEVISPPSRWIESVIAASVVLAALNNLRPVITRQRWVVTFAFGLVHGFGFAGALKDLGLAGGSLAAPLLGFNLGVELGQLAIVALFLPLAWALRSTVLYRRVLLQGGSVAVALVALVWLVERAFDLSLMA
jgi:hypothetical protein